MALLPMPSSSLPRVDGYRFEGGRSIALPEAGRLLAKDLGRI
jgi:hypothetical protein